MEQWKKQQEFEIEQLINSYVKKYTVHIAGKDYPPPSGWMRWLKDYICRRFQYIDKRSWVELLTTCDDDSDFINRCGEGARKWLISLREYAKDYGRNK